MPPRPRLDLIRKEPVAEPPSSDDLLREERHQLERAQVQAARDDLRHDRDHKTELFQQLKDAERRRWSVARVVFFATAAWLVLILFVVLLEGWRVLGFSLGAPALVALLSTTTVTVLGVTLVVARFLFPTVRD